MTRKASTSQRFDEPQIPVQIKLAAAWTSFMFLYIYVDYLILYKPGHVDGILAGMVWEFEVSQTFMTAALVSMAIPIYMIVFSMMLPARAARATNLVVATLYIPYSAFNMAGGTWNYFLGLGVGLEVLLLAFILRSAWTWPRTPAPAMSDQATTAGRLSKSAHA